MFLGKMQNFGNLKYFRIRYGNEGEPKLLPMTANLPLQIGANHQIFAMVVMKPGLLSYFGSSAF
jgi:hypothetical protein